MLRRSTVVLWLSLLFALASTSRAFAAPLAPPSAVRQALLGSDLVEILDVNKLPNEVRNGEFRVDGTRVGGDWKLAQPGAPWQATDVIVMPHLPDRRLIFAACDSTFCVVHYELGGIGHSMHLLALERIGAGYKTLWHAVGFGFIPNLKALRHLLRSGADTQFENAKAGYGY